MSIQVKNLLKKFGEQKAVNDVTFSLDKGDIVGFALDGTTFAQTALIWIDNKPVNLNTFIPANSPWTLQAASSINNAGEIAGVGLIYGETHAFLATPK